MILYRLLIQAVRDAVAIANRHAAVGPRGSASERKPPEFPRGDGPHPGIPGEDRSAMADDSPGRGGETQVIRPPSRPEGYYTDRLRMHIGGRPSNGPGSPPAERASTHFEAENRAFRAAPPPVARLGEARFGSTDPHRRRRSHAGHHEK